MSVVEDVRKAMQDFLAPELREIKQEFVAATPVSLHQTHHPSNRDFLSLLTDARRVV
jgi:hypothetical protein